MPEETTAERRYIAALPLDGATVVDVGAREGHMARLFAEGVGAAGRVVAYEPHPRNRELLGEHLAEISTVAVRPFALADAPGALTFAYPQELGFGSAEPAIRDGLLAAGAERLTFPVTTLDAEVAAGHAPPPDLVKIDVEGLELAVLRGMERLLRERAPDLLIEIHGADRGAKEANAAAVLSFLEAHGYECHHIESDRRVGVESAGLAVEGHLHARVSRARAAHLS